MSNGVQDAFKHNRARKNVIYGGAVILICITTLSCVSSFMIYRDGFADLPYILQQALSFFAVVVVEGAFVWLVYGYTRSFSSSLERTFCLAAMSVLVVVMLINLVTHFMMVKNIPLQPFQHAWISWGAITVFIAVLLFVLFITLSDPNARINRLELRYQGLQKEKEIEAKVQALDSERIQEAMSTRADYEANQLASRILGNAAQDSVRPAAGFASSVKPDTTIKSGSVFLVDEKGRRVKVGRPVHDENYEPDLDPKSQRR